MTAKNGSSLLSGAICVVLVAILLYHIIKAQTGKGIFKRISTGKFAVEIFESDDDSYFDKYLSEVLYLLRQCKADVVVFEDIDRYGANRIFERLREVNNLVNSQKNKQTDTKPLRFLYLLRDDIFVSKDRTKFFDFIIPIVPVVDSSNAYDQFIEYLNESGVWRKFDESFLQGISLYIDDLRILKNICNEFFIYDSCLNITELNPDKLMAIITYKNLFPRDFSDLQLGRGFVFTLFDKKKTFVAKKIAELESELNATKTQSDAIKKEPLVSIEELDLVFDNKRQSAEEEYTGVHQQEQLDLLEQQYASRKEVIEKQLYIPESKIAQLETEIARAKNVSLKDIISRENIDEVFAVSSENAIGVILDFKDVRGNNYFALLKYLIRNGYIDESYADYMTYFYEKSLNKADKIFLRSISDQAKKDPNYQLKNPGKVFAHLNVFDFTQPEVLNYDLLFYLLQECASYDSEILCSTDIPIFPDVTAKKTKTTQCLMAILDQILSVPDYTFLQRIFADIKDTRLNYLVNMLNSARKDCLTNILHNKAGFAANCRDDFVLRTLIVTPGDYLTGNNDFRNELSTFVSTHHQIIDEHNVKETKLQTMFGADVNQQLLFDQLINRFQLLEVYFDSIDYNTANNILFKAIYEKNLYALTYGNISHILSSIYGFVENTDYESKNYTLVMSEPNSSLAKYVNASLDEYLAEIIAYTDCVMADDEKFALAILNSPNISDDNKAAYVERLATIIQTLTEVLSVELRKMLICADIAAHSEKNVIDYYCDCSYTMTDELVEFINCKNNEYNYSIIINDYEDDIRLKFFVSVLKCNELNNDHYRHILRTLHRFYKKGFALDGVTDDKILILVDIGIIPMHKNTLAFMREHYSIAVLPYIEKNIDAYINEVKDDTFFDLDEVLKVLSLKIADKHKLALIKKIDGDLTANIAQYSDTVRAYILEHNFNKKDLLHFIANYPNEGKLTRAAIESITIREIDTIFVNEDAMDKGLADKLINETDISQDIKLKLFALVLPSSNEYQCKQYLTHFKLDKFLRLFDKKRPAFKKDEINERLLSIFLKKKWITKYQEERKDGKIYYRAYGRKARFDKNNALIS